MMSVKLWAVLLAGAATAAAQEKVDVSEILKRLDRLEVQNRELMTEIRSLKEQLATTANPKNASQSATPPPGAPVEEQVSVNSHRIEELDQSRVSAEHRLPISLTGTVLFNAFLNGQNGGGQMNPVVASAEPGLASGGASLRQTTIGFRFHGPDLPFGGKASGAAFFDFFAGTGTSLNQLLRLRVATVDLTWNNTTFTLGQDKPIFAPRDPDSLAQVGLSPLTGAGNLWIWQPQARVEHRLFFGERSGLVAQVGLFQTNEAGGGVSSEYAGSTANSRPGFEGRFNFWGEQGGHRWEIAPSFHTSRSHTIGQSVPSHVVSVDWLLRPVARIEFTGQVFRGENVGVVGGLRQGISIYDGAARAVRSAGGWAQVTFHATPRLWFNIHGGQQDDRNSDLFGDALAKNQIYAANLMYRLSSNILSSFEYSRVRTTYLSSGTRINPHYDLALAYLF